MHAPSNGAGTPEVWDDAEPMAAQAMAESRPVAQVRAHAVIRGLVGCVVSVTGRFDKPMIIWTLSR
jgi:hypothetical protein